MVVCVPSHNRTFMFLEKIIGNDTTFRLFSLLLHADTNSAHADVETFAVIHSDG